MRPEQERDYEIFYKIMQDFGGNYNYVLVR